jgi:AraC family transcriptional regulator
MKLAAAGRILLWNGGSLWIGRSGPPTDQHSHHAVQIGLALSDDDLHFRCGDGAWKSYRTALIAAHQAHAFDGHGNLVGTIFVEPESREGQALQQRCLKEGIVGITEGTLDREKSLLLASYSGAASDTALVDVARSVISTLTATSRAPVVTLDPRIERALELIRKRIGDTIALADIAEAAHLSPDRFRHLFQEQTGTRFRPYVLWLRIEVALAAFAANRSLTEAAHAGGFADSAHFSRTFRNMFGIAPSSIQID